MRRRPDSTSPILHRRPSDVSHAGPRGLPHDLALHRCSARRWALRIRPDRITRAQDVAQPIARPERTEGGQGPLTDPGENVVEPLALGQTAWKKRIGNEPGVQSSRTPSSRFSRGGNLSGTWGTDRMSTPTRPLHSGEPQRGSRRTLRTWQPGFSTSCGAQ